MAQEQTKLAGPHKDRVALALALIRSLPAQEACTLMLEAEERLAHLGPLTREVRSRVSGRQSNRLEEWVVRLGPLAGKVLWAETEAAVEAGELVADMLRSDLEIILVETEMSIRAAIHVAAQAGDEAAVKAREAKLAAFPATAESMRAVVPDTEAAIEILRAEHLDAETRSRFGPETNILDVVWLVFPPVRPRAARDRALENLARGMRWRWYPREWEAWRQEQRAGETSPRAVVKQHFQRIGLFLAARDIRLTALCGSSVLNYRLPELVASKAVAAARNILESQRRPEKEIDVPLDEVREAVEPPPSETLHPLDMLARSQELEEVLDLATPPEREVLELLAEGWSVAEACRRLGIPPGTGRQRLHTFRTRISRTNLTV